MQLYWISSYIKFNSSGGVKTPWYFLKNYSMINTDAFQVFWYGWSSGLQVFILIYGWSSGLLVFILIYGWRSGLQVFILIYGCSSGLQVFILIYGCSSGSEVFILIYGWSSGLQVFILIYGWSSDLQVFAMSNTFWWYYFLRYVYVLHSSWIMSRRNKLILNLFILGKLI